MASPARRARLAAQARGFTEIAFRGRNKLVTRNPSTGKYHITAGLGGLGWHLGDGTEIDTAWLPDVGAWQYKMELAEYHAYARNVLNAGDTVQYLEPTSGATVTFQPLALNWVDNLTDSRQQIAQPQAVTAVVNDDMLVWENGYGAGRHFTWQTQTGRLQKVLTIDSPANLPAPTVANPYLEIEFITKYSGVDPWIDGVEWNRRDKTATPNYIEFRSETTGEVLWYFRYPRAWDADNDNIGGIYQVRRQGANLYCTVRFPKAWIDAAVFPIHLDDVVQQLIGASLDDAFEGATGSVAATNTTIRSDAASEWLGWRWQNIGIAADATISEAWIDHYCTNVNRDEPNHRYYGQLGDAAAFSEATSYDVSSRADTTAYADWINTGLGAPGWFQTGASNDFLTNVVQEIVNDAGWASGYDMCIVCVFNDTGGDLEVQTYDGSTTVNSELNITYTVAGGGDPEGSLIGGKLLRGGLLTHGVLVRG